MEHVLTRKELVREVRQMRKDFNQNKRVALLGPKNRQHPARKGISKMNKKQLADHIRHLHRLYQES